MKKMYVIYAIMIFLSIVLSGCIEEKEENNEDETNEETIDQDYENMILGIWVRNETYGNFTYIMAYNFFSNQSFFSGVKDESIESYNVSIWGNYSIDSEEIQFIVGGDIPSSSTHKYLISSEGDLLLLYYEDGINYDVLRKET
jgi:hypothetical protein